MLDEKGEERIEDTASTRLLLLTYNTGNIVILGQLCYYYQNNQVQIKEQMLEKEN